MASAALRQRVGSDAITYDRNRTIERNNDGHGSNNPIQSRSTDHIISSPTMNRYIESHSTAHESPIISSHQSIPFIFDTQHPSPPAIIPTWTNMPNKSQLFILALSRFVDFFQMAALQTYMVHQLKSFDPSLSPTIVAHQAGVLQGSFTAAQIFTSIIWGRLADRPSVGRKLVLNIGLIGTGITMLGIGFSTSYEQVVAWRLLGGAINGTVGAARTMVAETVDKKWHPRAFLLLPAAFNVASVAGPILGGTLVNPVLHFPGLFGVGSWLGGIEGVGWMRKYPFALPNVCSTVFLFLEATLVWFGLKETLKGYRGLDWSLLESKQVSQSLRNLLKGMGMSSARDSGHSIVLKERLLAREDSPMALELDNLNAGLGLSTPIEGEKIVIKRAPAQLPFRRIWTKNVIWTLASNAIFDFHMGAFNNLWILFLSSSRTYLPSTDTLPPPISTPSSLFKFSGGLAFPPSKIGSAMAILGFIGIILQLLLYPWANAKFGLMRCFRWSLILFPICYFLAPYIVRLPSSTVSPAPAEGFWIWFGIVAVLALQVSARTFALPASIMLVNNSSPHPSVLATIHGLGQANSATFRTLGPLISGNLYGTWFERGMVGMAWWIVAAISCIGCIFSYKVRNGSGHEIILEGDDDPMVKSGDKPTQK